MSLLTRSNDTFVIHTFGKRDTFDPHLAEDEASIHVIQNVYETPFAQYVENGEIKFKPMLSPEIPTMENGGISNDGKTIGIKLRNGVQNHLLDTVSIEDLRYSLARSLILSRGTSAMGELCRFIWGTSSDIDIDYKCRNVGRLEESLRIGTKDNELFIHLKEKFSPVLSILSNWLFIVSKRWCAKIGDWDGTWENVEQLKDVLHKGGLQHLANGTGPYRVEYHYDSTTILERHDSYWDKKGYFKRVIIGRTDDPQDRKQLLEDETVDFAVCAREVTDELSHQNNVTIYDNLPELNVNPIGAFTFKISTDGNEFIGSAKLDGTGIPPDFFSDPHVRKACSFSFDYERFLADGLNGKGKRALGPVPSRIYPSVRDAALLKEAPVYDIEKAKKEWKAAWGGELYKKGCRFTILTHDGNPERIFAAEVLADGLRQLGPNVNIDVLPVEWTQYFKLIREHKAPVFWIGWQADYGDPHSFARGLTHSGGYFAVAQQFNFPELDQLVKIGLMASEESERSKIYKELNIKALELAPHIYTYERERFVVLNNSIKGLEFNPFRASVFYYRDLYRQEDYSEKAVNQLV